MNIGIIGNGVVGGATAYAFRPVVDEIRFYDADVSRKTHSFADTLACDIVFLCLPTPQEPSSSACDTRHLDTILESLEPQERKANLVIRSTVPIGHTRKAAKRYSLPNLSHFPEFLTARTANEDAANPVRIVIGDEYWGPLHDLCVKRWPDKWMSLMPSDESEAVKLFQNAFSAVKIACFNRFRHLADTHGMNWDRVLEALLAGGWINKMHTQVPGPDGRRGFGGACLVKDLANLIACCYESGVPCGMFEAVRIHNAVDRKRP